MKLWKKICLLGLLMISGAAFAEDGMYLVKADGTADLATGKSGGKGKYLFTLIPGKTVGKKPVTFSMVEKSFQNPKMKKLEVTVSQKGAEIVAEYKKGDEKEFLALVGATRIRNFDNQLAAVDSSQSGGEMRARTSVREPGDDEVRGMVLKTGKAGMVMVQAIGANIAKNPAVKKSATKVNLEGKDVKNNQTVFITFGEQKDGVWEVKELKAD